jgi:hypothetical protein
MRADNYTRRGGRRRAFSADQRASKNIAVSPETMAHLIAKQRGAEASEDTLRRLLGMPERAGA